MKLLDCPFCGGIPSLGKGIGYTFVNCGECLASTNVLTADAMQYTDEEAAELWNKRTDNSNGDT